MNILKNSNCPYCHSKTSCRTHVSGYIYESCNCGYLARLLISTWTVGSGTASFQYDANKEFYTTVNMLLCI